MQLRSLARRTDLIFARFEGEVTDHGDYISVKTRSNPGYHWGNYLIFAAPPGPGDQERWQTIFRSEFDFYPTLRHMVFCWEGGEAEPGQLQPFLDRGFSLDRALVLTAAQVRPPARRREDLLIRPLESEKDWEQAIALQILCRDQRFEAGGYEAFKRRQFATYRAMVAQGLGHWFGAFAGTELVGDLGIFHQAGLGRFQNVGTHPGFRRQGICGNLVYATARYALETWKLEQLVMEADADYHAAGIYESLGFRPVESNYSLSWDT